MQSLSPLLSRATLASTEKLGAENHVEQRLLTELSMTSRVSTYLR